MTFDTLQFNARIKHSSTTVTFARAVNSCKNHMRDNFGVIARFYGQFLMHIPSRAYDIFVTRSTRDDISLFLSVMRPRATSSAPFKEHFMAVRV